MKVRVSYTVEVDDFFRRALSYAHGEKRLASREEIQQHYERVGDSEDGDIVSDYQMSLNAADVLSLSDAQRDVYEKHYYRDAYPSQEDHVEAIRLAKEVK